MSDGYTSGRCRYFVITRPIGCLTAAGRDQVYWASCPAGSKYVLLAVNGWLIECQALSPKLTRTMLRGIRVKSKQELIRRLHQCFAELNAKPVVFRWKNKMDEVA